MITVKLHINDEVKEIGAAEGENLLDILRKQSVFTDIPCGGNGTCGKCIVKIEGNVHSPTTEEKNILGDKLNYGYRLSCCVTINSDTDVYVDNKESENDIVTWGKNSEFEIDPVVDKEGYALAVDIGTTTVAVYLIDLKKCQVENVHSFLNKQKMYGADVISRIGYTIENETGTRVLSDLIRNSINDAIKHFNLCKNEVKAINFVGNTTMLHLLMGYETRTLAVAPFTPVTTKLQQLHGKDLDIELAEQAKVYISPCISAYVGADIVSSVLASGMCQKSDKMDLLIDIGTNGEMAIGNSNRIVCCSTAAGPAFEGANIKCGIGGIKGAVSKFYYDNGYKYETIGGEKAIGICGSGIISIVSTLLDTGVIDETGRILDKDEFEDSENRLIEFDGNNAFKITEDIIITQKDIREIQNAKAAIAAGIKVLISKSGCKEDIENIYLAGGFGSKIDIDCAVNIGMLPSSMRDKICAIGNAAGHGSIRMILSNKELEKAIDLSESAEYIELSTDKEFTDYYVENMFF